MNNTYLLLIGSLIVLILIILFFKRRTVAHEHFTGPGSNLTLECMVQTDDRFVAMYDGKQVGLGDDWQKVYRFNIPNVRAGTKVYFYVNNLGGQGFIRAQFKIGDLDIFSDLSTLKPLSKQAPNIPVPLGNRYVGCMRDNTYSRDLPILVGSNMSRDECLKTAYNNNYNFYGLQGGGECWLGNSFGRWGIADNCNMPCQTNNTEKCGGSLANQVYAVNDAPKAIEVNVQSSSDFDRRAKALWIESGDDYAQGNWIWELTIPDTNVLDFCPDVSFREFNPAGCQDATNPSSCEMSAYPSYRVNRSKCSVKYDYENPELFYITLNKLFNAIVKNTQLGADNINADKKENNVVYFANNFNPKIDNCNCDKNAQGQRDEFRAKYKTLIHYSNPATYGSIEYSETTGKNAWEPYLQRFMSANLKLNRIIVMIGRKMDYLIDNRQLLDENHVIPNTPMYYALIQLAQKYSKTNNDPLSVQFNMFYKDLYDTARIITGIPKFVRECSCLGLSFPGSVQCVPC